MMSAIFGIGIDRFGEYYREYAVQVQVVQVHTKVQVAQVIQTTALVLVHTIKAI